MKFLHASIFFLIIITLFTVAQADFSSTNFQLENPVIITSGGQSSSSSFKYLSTTAQIAQGQSASVNFAQNAGFLYFPTATSPVVSATPGNAQVLLSWTAATGILANITSYKVGTGTVSGSYTFEDVGNVTNFTKTGLTNSTPYFFKIRSYASGLLLSEGAEVSATPVASVTPPAGGGAQGSINTGVIFSGMAYPGSNVFLLKDGQIAASTITGGDAKFKITLTGLSSGNFNFLMYARDGAQRKSTLFTFPVTLSIGVVTEINGIFIAPTIAVDKEQVKKGDNITILGQSVPQGEVSISVHSDPEIFVRTNTDKYGGYLYNLDTSILDYGDHLTKSKALKTGEISPFGQSVAFKVGDKTLFTVPSVPEQIEGGGSCNSIADFNHDCRVNLVDYSILAFWYKKASIPLNVDLNHDGKVSIIDFSIMAYYWTI